MWYVVACMVLLFAVPAFAQGANCNNSVGGDNTGPLTNNCPTYNFEAPKLPWGIYQNGQLIGTVGHAHWDGHSSTMTITNLKISSGTVDVAAPMQIQSITFSCDAVRKTPQATMLVLSIGEEITCDIIRN